VIQQLYRTFLFCPLFFFFAAMLQKKPKKRRKRSVSEGRQKMIRFLIAVYGRTVFFFLFDEKRFGYLLERVFA